jgi:hypothetical protein
LEDPQQTQQQILERSKALLEFEVTLPARHEIEWELVEGPAVAACFNVHSRPRVSAIIALFKSKHTPSREDIIALFDKKFLEGVAAVITLFDGNPYPACDDVIAMFNEKPWPRVEDVQRDRERIRGKPWPPTFVSNAEWEFHHDAIMTFHDDPEVKSAGKIQTKMSHYPFNFMPKCVSTVEYSPETSGTNDSA